MKNRLPFAALTFAFTVAGAAVGSSLEASTAGLIVLGLATIGGLAAALSGADV